MSNELDAALVRISDPELAKVVERARIEILLNQPYLASAVMRIPVVQVHAEQLPSGIGVAPGAITVSQALRLAPTAVVSYGYAHNLVHCLFEHLDRRNGRIKEIWTLAMDIATAALLDPLLDPKLQAASASPNIQPRRSAEFDALVAALGMLSCEQIYDALASTARGAGGAGGTGSAGGAKRKPPSGGGALSRPMILDDTAEGSGAMMFEGRPGERSHAFEDHMPLPPDASCTGEELQLLLHEVTEAIRSDVGLGRGTLPGIWNEVARQSRTRPIPWQRIFAQHLEGMHPVDFQFFPFSKRHLWRGIYLPSIARKSSGRVLFAIDTSGSMSLGVLGQITDQLDQLRQATECSLTLVHFDHEVQRVSRFDEFTDPIDAGTLAMPGRGGTDIRAPFAFMDAERGGGERFAGIVVATDGEGPIPEAGPDLPTIWLVPGYRAASFTPHFGSVVAIQQEVG